MGNLKDLDDLLIDAPTAARNLLGWKLVHDTPEGRTGGYIVETEAYTEDDPASHAYGGPNKRNAAMFQRAGTIYIYFTYGMHYCLNIVAGRPGRGEAVLIRALEPSYGLELMKNRRGIVLLPHLTNGPAKLVQALGIKVMLNGSMINTMSLKLEPGLKPRQVMQAPRIGISKAVDVPWRFYIKGNRFVSRPS